jgi:ubiquinone/menaquinone biosynthesis C-methylase UbiE
MKLTYRPKIDFLKKLYLNRTNINQYLRKKTNLSEKEIIKLSYDIQSGSYVKNYNYFKSKKILSQVIKEINSTDYKSLMDFGCGELTNFYTLINNIKIKNKTFFAYDLSFSRIMIGKKFLDKKKKKIELKLFSNNSINIPLPDNSIDVITSCHAIEPNKKNANKILKELWRISKKKLILLEPNNQLGDKLIKQRFKEHNYILDLEEKIKKITPNYKIIDNKIFFNPLNPSSIFILEKNSNKSNKFNFLNPKDSNDILKKKLNFFYSKKTGQMFPIVDDIIIFNKNEIYAL